MKAITIVLASALITATGIKVAPAIAEPGAATDNIAVTRVLTADLDLSTRGGLRALDRRLSHAARQVCGEASDFDVEGKNEVRSCRDETLSRARLERDAAIASLSRGSVIAVTAAR